MDRDSPRRFEMKCSKNKFLTALGLTLCLSFMMTGCSKKSGSGGVNKGKEVTQVTRTQLLDQLKDLLNKPTFFQVQGPFLDVKVQLLEKEKKQEKEVALHPVLKLVVSDGEGITFGGSYILSYKKTKDSEIKTCESKIMGGTIADSSKHPSAKNSLLVQDLMFNIICEDIAGSIDESNEGIFYSFDFFVESINDGTINFAKSKGHKKKRRSPNLKKKGSMIKVDSLEDAQKSEGAVASLAGLRPFNKEDIKEMEKEDIQKLKKNIAELEKEFQGLVNAKNLAKKAFDAAKEKGKIGTTKIDFQKAVGALETRGIKITDKIALIKEELANLDE